MDTRKERQVNIMATRELLEKAGDRVFTKARARGTHTKGRLNTELGAMVDLLKFMGFVLDFDWDEDDVTKIIGVRVSFGGETVEKTA